MGNIEKSITKQELFGLFRQHSTSIIESAKDIVAESDYRKRATLVNKGVLAYKNDLVAQILQRSQEESWEPAERLHLILLTTYVSYVVMLESRNQVWPYDYMAFARRVGELWEPFCFLCWEYPINTNIAFIDPPKFSEVKDRLGVEVNDYIRTLDVSDEQRAKLNEYYNLVWALVGSGEIKLASDLHFKDEEKSYIVDFKSGFSSNEKGNTNRLLTVASIYKAIGGFECILFVRAKEEYNNHYLQTLKRSGLWQVYCGDETYEQISKFAGFDLSGWIKANVAWEVDFTPDVYNYLKVNKLIQYLEW